MRHKIVKGSETARPWSVYDNLTSQVVFRSPIKVEAIMELVTREWMEIIDSMLSDFDDSDTIEEIISEIGMLPDAIDTPQGMEEMDAAEDQIITFIPMALHRLAERYELEWRSMKLKQFHPPVRVVGPVTEDFRPLDSHLEADYEGRTEE